MGVPAAVSKRVSEGEDRGQHAAAGPVPVAVLLAVVLGLLRLFRGPFNASVGYPAARFAALVLLLTVILQVVMSTIQGLHLVGIHTVYADCLPVGRRNGSANHRY
jgi:O-antigen/teichoic acid export membrane protein